MKIAIVHDTLTEFGGAERALLSLLEIFPQADIFTACARKSFITHYLSEISETRIHVSFIGNMILPKHTSLFQIAAPSLWKQWNFESYDIVIAHASHLMANLVNVKRPLFIQYIQSPPKNIFGLESLTPLQRLVPYTTYIRREYSNAICSADLVLSNSQHTKRVLNKLFHISSRCVYAPVFIPTQKPHKQQGKYYLIVSRLDRTKSIEIAIRACNITQDRLVIVGKANEKSYEDYLHKISGKTITFVGFQPDDTLTDYFTHAKAFLFTAKNEDFGIAPIEAMAHGVPVIAFAGGGVKETVIEGKTGHLFYQHNVQAVVQAIRTIKSIKFSVDTLYQYATKFSDKQFKKNIKRHINTVMLQKRGS